jgi:hypothetical protein
MPKSTSNRQSSSKAFGPPKPGQVPDNYRPTTHTSVRVTDFGANVDAEWTTFAYFDPATGERTGQIPYWFTATCLVRNDKLRVRMVRLRDIGAQARVGTIRVRVSGTKNPAVKVSTSDSGQGGKPVKPVGGFFPIEPSYDKDGKPSDKYYTLSFNGPLCFLECYNTLLCLPKPPSGPRPLISDGYPPAGTPEESE